LDEVVFHGGLVNVEDRHRHVICQRCGQLHRHGKVRPPTVPFHHRHAGTNRAHRLRLILGYIERLTSRIVDKDATRQREELQWKPTRPGIQIIIRNEHAENLLYFARSEADRSFHDLIALLEAQSANANGNLPRQIQTTAHGDVCEAIALVGQNAIGRASRDVWCEDEAWIIRERGVGRLVRGEVDGEREVIREDRGVLLAYESLMTRVVT